MVDESLIAFSKACGLAGVLKVRVEGAGPSGPGLFEHSGPALIAGRGPLADIRIDDPKVSACHAYFQVVAGRLFCVDLGSRSGVIWADGRRPAGWVDPSEGVAIGPARLRFEGIDAAVEEPGNHPPISRSFRWADLPEAGLEFLGPGSGRPPWQVSRALTLLGTSPICRLQLPGPGIAGVHAALLRTPSGIWAVSLPGFGGITHGGEPARHARLEDGDEIGLGDQRIRIRFGRHDRPAIGPEAASVPGLRESPPPPASRDDPGGGSRDLAGSVDPVTARLIDEFRQMHQQTTEQFQQAILLMFRMHQDQMGAMREELSRLDRLERELVALQSGSDRSAQGPAHAPRLRLVSGDGPSARPDGSGPRPFAVGGSASFGGGQARDFAPGNRPSRADDPASPLDNYESHASIARRIAEIADERKGIWGKILASLSGEGGDRRLF